MILSSPGAGGLIFALLLFELVPIILLFAVLFFLVSACFSYEEFKRIRIRLIIGLFLLSFISINAWFFVINSYFDRGVAEVFGILIM